MVPQKGSGLKTYPRAMQVHGPLPPQARPISGHVFEQSATEGALSSHRSSLTLCSPSESDIKHDQSYDERYSTEEFAEKLKLTLIRKSDVFLRLRSLKKKTRSGEQTSVSAGECEEPKCARVGLGVQVKPQRESAAYIPSSTPLWLFRHAKHARPSVP